mmetsp:Transcript_56657/g.159823  ORF Transcript_56657/g.159823 Transcript_56657/m.159823 type:complete len:258 (-) Transcript_56657:498-1271(-)
MRNRVLSSVHRSNEGTRDRRSRGSTSSAGRACRRPARGPRLQASSIEDVQADGNNGPALLATKSLLKKESVLRCSTSASSSTRARIFSTYAALGSESPAKRSPSSSLSDSGGRNIRLRRSMFPSSASSLPLIMDQNALPATPGRASWEPPAGSGLGSLRSNLSRFRSTPFGKGVVLGSVSRAPRVLRPGRAKAWKETSGTWLTSLLRWGNAPGPVQGNDMRSKPNSTPPYRPSLVLTAPSSGATIAPSCTLMREWQR